MTVWISNIKSKENMKRIFNALGLMLVSALTLTNCTKNIETPVVESEGVPFEIVASTVETKTVNDGMSTLWKTGDQINLFHAVAGTTTYSNDNNFTVNNVETGLFKGTLTGTLAEDAAYDWYAFYPYTSQMTTPANTSAYAYIGNRYGLTQNGYDSMAHVSGTNCPLYGVAKAVPSGEMPSLQMHHLSSVIAVKVTNTLETTLKVNEVVFTADGNDLTGSFYINIAGDEATYKPSTGYVSTEAKVTVNNATELAEGESATVYIVIVPFEAYEGDTLELIVNGYKKDIKLEKDVDFEAGKIKTLNFAYDKEPEEPENPEVPEFEPGNYWIVANGKYAMPVTGTYGYLQVDKAGYTDNVFTFKEVEGGYTIQQVGGKYLYMTGTYDSFNVSASVPADGGHIWTVEKNDDGSYKILNVLKSKYVQLDSQYGTYGAYTAVKGTMPNLVPADDATVRPVFAVAGNSMTVECDVTEASFELTSNQNWTVVPGEGVSVNVTSGSGNATITLTFAENTTEEAIVYTATVKAAGLNDIVLTVNQKGVSTGDEPVGGGTDDFDTITSTNTSYVSGTTKAGWSYKNSAIFKGGTSDSSPAFKMIGAASNRALCMNGKTSAVGSITSPTLTDGCGTLKFCYGLPFSDTKIKFRVDIKQGGTVVKTFTINNTSAAKLTKYEHEEVVNVSGDFQIVFTNLSPSNSTSNKDRTAIWDVEWTGYAE